jgi:hypothetical protein
MVVSPVLLSRKILKMVARGNGMVIDVGMSFFDTGNSSFRIMLLLNLWML